MARRVNAWCYVKKTKLILGIESSCDDTSVCLLRGDASTLSKVEILSHLSFSQEILLRKWGGVVPEIAARNHLSKLAPLLQEAFDQSKISPEEVDVLAVTTHPGLLGPLLTGLNSAKTLCLLYERPLIPVNHLYAHLEAIHIEQDVTYPYLGVLVSGGHSAFFKVHNKEHFEVLGQTLDDAAGEAFDKGGKLLGLGYPAGRIIDELAKKGNENAFEFPIGLRHSPDANLSYSGVKTFLRQMLEEQKEIAAKNPSDTERSVLWDVCASYQKSIVEALIIKGKKALEAFGEKNPPLVIGGGVACNSYLRKRFAQEFKNVHIVAPKFCTDNAAMIANYAYRNPQLAIAFPECLSLDAKGRHLDKGRST